jgi:hypothetical protein
MPTAVFTPGLDLAGVGSRAGPFYRSRPHRQELAPKCPMLHAISSGRSQLRHIDYTRNFPDERQSAPHSGSALATSGRFQALTGEADATVTFRPRY